MDGQIDGEKAKIADMKRRIVALTGESPVTAPIGSLLVPQGPKMFGFTQNEVVISFLFALLMPLMVVVVRRLWRSGAR